jgi:two-component system phosphate regulon response regulator PhoB
MLSGAQQASTEPQESILVVDDEDPLRRLVAFNLAEAGFSVVEAGTARDAFVAARSAAPAVVVLDLMLPDTNGIVVCTAVRADPELQDMGVLILSARGDERDRLAGLAAGADDYVVKPFSVRELVHRVRRLARWTRERRLARSWPSEPLRAAEPSRWLSWRKLRVDIARHQVHDDGVEIVLRPLEFRLLVLFLSNPGRLFTRTELLVEIWGVERSESRTVDTQICRLRERLGPHGCSIETVPGFGYRLGAP